MRRSEIVRIGTWNILGQRNYRRDNAIAIGGVCATLNRCPVDVLAMQEVHFYDGEPDPRLIAELRAVGLDHFVGRTFSLSHLDARAQLGVGIGSRFPLSDVTEYRLENPGLTAEVRGAHWTLHDKGLVRARVHLDDRRSLVVHSLHLFPFFEFGVRDDDELVSRMWEEFWRYADEFGREIRTVLAGDYNQADRRAAMKELSELDWTFHAADLTTTATGMSLDDIAVNWASYGPAARTVPTFSDHHLVIAEIEA
jgi:endonuclease/exonuclease/phosphatase family metal-dependent hydrolase